MTSRHFLLALSTACAVLLAGLTQAASTGPTAAQVGRPAPTRRAPAARPAAPVAAAKAALVVASPQPEAAPRTVLLAGTVQAPDGRPYPGVCVSPTTNPHLLAVTDATGTFRLQVPASLSPINLQADYFGVASRRVAVDGQHPQAITIVLGQ